MSERTLSSRHRIRNSIEPWRSEAEHATSRSRSPPTILTFTRGWERNIFCFFQTAKIGNRTPSSGVKGSSANHYPRAPASEVNEAFEICQSKRRPIIWLIFYHQAAHPADKKALVVISKSWLPGYRPDHIIPHLHKTSEKNDLHCQSITRAVCICVSTHVLNNIIHNTCSGAYTQKIRAVQPMLF